MGRGGGEGGDKRIGSICLNEKFPRFCFDLARVFFRFFLQVSKWINGRNHLLTKLIAHTHTKKSKSRNSHLIFLKWITENEKHFSAELYI